MYPEELSELLDECRGDIDRYWTELENGMPVAEWKSKTIELLGYFFFIAALLGLGKALGYDKTPAISTELRKRITTRLQSQINYVDNFAQEILDYQEVERDRDAIKRKKRWRSRARMYAGSIQPAYWEGAAGCFDPFGLPMPGDGTTECLSNCRCHWRIVVVDKDNCDFDYFWELGIAEHCETCKRRAKLFYPIQIRGGVITTPIAKEFIHEHRDEEIALKHLAGQHNQKRHGYRYGRTPTLEQARSIVQAGLWEDYIARARAYSGKGARPIPTDAEFRSAQDAIKNARNVYGEKIDIYNKEFEKYHKKSEKISLLYKNATDTQQKYQDLEHKRYKMENDAYDKYDKRIDYLKSKQELAYSKRDYDLYDKLTDEISRVIDKKGAFIASLSSSGTYYSTAQGKTVRVKNHPIVAQIDKAHSAWYRAKTKVDKMESNPKSYGSSAKLNAAKEEMDKAKGIYLSSTASARRTAMAYLRNDAMQIRKKYLELDRKEARNVQKLENELAELKSQGNYDNVFSPNYHKVYSLSDKIQRIKSGDSASQRTKTELQTALMLPDDKSVRINAEFKKPTIDPSALNSIETIESIRRNGIDIASTFIGRNSLIERSKIVVDNGDYSLYGGRAYAKNNSLMLMAGSHHVTVLHETGHVIEHLDPAILVESLRFKARRTKRDVNQKLSSVTNDSNYSNDEETRKDSFLDAYIGKDYGNYASEVLSMGLQMLYDGNVFRMMNLDPDMFGYIYSVLRLGTD